MSQMPDDIFDDEEPEDDCGKPACGCGHGECCDKCNRSPVRPPIIEGPTHVIHQTAPVENEHPCGDDDEEEEPEDELPLPCFRIPKTDIGDVDFTLDGMLFVGTLDTDSGTVCLKPFRPEGEGCRGGALFVNNDGTLGVLAKDEVEETSLGEPLGELDMLYGFSNGQCRPYGIMPEAGKTLVSCDGKWVLRDAPEKDILLDQAYEVLNADIINVDAAAVVPGAPIGSGAIDLKSEIGTQYCELFSGCVTAVDVQAIATFKGRNTVKFFIGSRESGVTTSNGLDLPLSSCCEDAEHESYATVAGVIPVRDGRYLDWQTLSGAAFAEENGVSLTIKVRSIRIKPCCEVPS